MQCFFHHGPVGIPLPCWLISCMNNLAAIEWKVFWSYQEHEWRDENSSHVFDTHQNITHLQNVREREGIWWWWVWLCVSAASILITFSFILKSAESCMNNLAAAIQWNFFHSFLFTHDHVLQSQLVRESKRNCRVLS